MATLFDAILELAKILMPVVEDTAAGGSTTTLSDDTRTEPDQHFTKGTIFMRSGPDAGKSRMVTNYASNTFTFLALTDDDPTGNLYSACERDYPRWLLIQSINKALLELGDMPEVVTSLTTVADQESYDLPNGVRNVTRVEIATSLTTPYNYKIHYNWREFDDDLWFDEGFEPQEDGYIIRLTYNLAQAELSDDTDTIEPNVHILPLVWLAAVHALRWRYRARGRPKDIELELKEAIAMAEIMRGRYKTVTPMDRDPHHANW